MPVWWKIGDEGPSRPQLTEIVAVLRIGGVVLAPTDTIYGLHALANDERAINRIFEIKGRPPEKALPVLFASVQQLRVTGADLSSELAVLLQEIWPAPLTAIVPLHRRLPASAGSSTIAARVPAVGWLRELIGETGPLASTSANRSGEAPITDPRECPEVLEKQLDGVIDAGLNEGAASTIVDFTASPPVLVRPGEFFFTQNLWKKLRKTL